MILELKHIGTPEQHFASRQWTISWQTIQFGSVEVLAGQALSHTIHPFIAAEFPSLALTAALARGLRPEDCQ
jgi:hypothetical protein